MSESSTGEHLPTSNEAMLLYMCVSSWPFHFFPSSRREKKEENQKFIIFEQHPGREAQQIL
jgi:hypothetical protein